MTTPGKQVGERRWRILAAAVLITPIHVACVTVENGRRDAQLLEADRAYGEARKKAEARRYEEALPLAMRALEIREAILGSAHEGVADCLSLLGGAHLRLGAYAPAERSLRRALEIREVALGRNDPRVAASLNNLGSVYLRQGQYERAEPLLQRALAIRESTWGGEHPEVAASLANLAILYQRQGKYEQAETLSKRALAILEAVHGPNHPELASALDNLATIYLLKSQYALAEPLFERALAIRETAWGKEHIEVASSLNNLASLQMRRALYAQAEPLYERALTIKEGALGRDHPDVASSLQNLANLYRHQGHYTLAESMYQRALAIWETALGREHPNVATLLYNIANFYHAQGKYAQAEPLYARALEMGEASLGKEHPEVARALNGLAQCYHIQGQYARAEPLLMRAVEILKAALGEEHPETARSLGLLANLYAESGRGAEAEPLYQRALAMREAVLGKEHHDVAYLLDNLAQLYMRQARHEQARPLLERALAIREATFGEAHAEVAYSLQFLATLHLREGRDALAGPMYERALALREAALGEDHPAVAESLRSLALFHLSQQRIAEALPLFERAFHISEAHLRREAFGFSEAGLEDFLRLLRFEEEEHLYTLASTYPGNSRVRRMALVTALLRKGRSAEEIAGTSRLIHGSLSQADSERFERLRALRTQLAALSLSGPASLSPAEYRQRFKAFATEGDTLEAELARRSAPLRALVELPPPEELLSRMAEALPRNGVLVEFVAYSKRLLVPGPGVSEAQPSREMHYLALLLFADGRTMTRDLGPAAPIDHAAVRLHDLLAGNAASYRPAAQALHALLFRPLMPLLGNARRLFLSTDAQLTLVPFAALHDGSRFLADTFEMTYLVSGKDLLPRPGEAGPAQSVVVIADPEFDARLHEPALTARSERARAGRPASLERFYSTRFVAEPDSPWPPLPGTRQEAQAIKRLLPQAQLLLGSDATKEALLALSAPGVLHVATHGKFFEGGAASVARGLPGHGGGGQSVGPLLRSVLVLAGAQAPMEQPGAYRREDSFVTALELAGLNLWGTQLVVLSACDTGRGDVKLGQGVYGLRRALVVAGAQTVVTSLWRVKDDTTRQLMEDYYRNLLAGQGRIAALRRAMQALRRKHPHPYFWAPFVAMGQDSPLKGLVPHVEAQVMPSN